MTPCTCNTEMGDTCPKCAPQPVAPAPQPAPDREGWPVLVAKGGWYAWDTDDDAVVPVEKGWEAWTETDEGFCIGTFTSKEAAALALHARLPDEASALAPVDPHDAEIATLRADYATVSEELTGWRNRANDLRASCLAILGELPDSDMTDYGIVDKLRTRIVGAETHIAMHPGRYDSRLLDHALALLDLAAEKNETLQHIAAILRVGVGRP